MLCFKIIWIYELAMVLGLSDVVVDLVESGQLKQNGLIEIEVIDKISLCS